MKFAAEYFKEPASDALKEFHAWAEKWFRDDVTVAMLMIERRVSDDALILTAAR